MTDEERRSKCHFYDQIVNPKGCSNHSPCPFGKERTVDGKRLCSVAGDIGGVNARHLRHRP